MVKIKISFYFTEELYFFWELFLKVQCCYRWHTYVSLLVFLQLWRWSGLFGKLSSPSGSQGVKCKGEMKCLLYLVDGLSLYVLMYLSSSCLYVSEKREGSVTIDSQSQCEEFPPLAKMVEHEVLIWRMPKASKLNRQDPGIQKANTIIG